MAGGGGGFTFSASPSSLDDNPLVPRRPAHDEAKFDITAMIDLVFMMNIFFLVTTVTAALAEIDLPAARHCAPADRDTSVLLTIMAGPDRGPGLLSIDEGPQDLSLADIDVHEPKIRAAVEAGVRANKNTVLIKAEKKVRLKDVSRVGAIAVAVPGTELKLAVFEKE
jgi:biopolymer transport protein ExbD